MSSQAIRIDTKTLNALRLLSERRGEPIVRLAQRFIEEGMRVDRHPGITFRDGPAGRRAALVAGPDVWEIIVAANGAPERNDALIAALVERLGVAAEKVRTAIRYYAEFPDEVDAHIAHNEREAELFRAVCEREAQLLG